MNKFVKSDNQGLAFGRTMSNFAIHKKVPT